MDTEHRRVVVVDDQDLVDLDVARFEALVVSVLAAEDVPPRLEATVTFVTPEAMADIRAEHYDGIHAPTDVLAFPIDDDVAPGMPGLLGDVVICPAVCRDRAPERVGLRLGHDGTVHTDLVVMVVHGVMHLLGHEHDDDTDAEVMLAHEERHLARWFSVPDPESPAR